MRKQKHKANAPVAPVKLTATSSWGDLTRFPWKHFVSQHLHCCFHSMRFGQQNKINKGRRAMRPWCSTWAESQVSGTCRILTLDSAPFCVQQKHIKTIKQMKTGLKHAESEEMLRWFPPCTFKFCGLRFHDHLNCTLSRKLNYVTLLLHVSNIQIRYVKSWSILA